MKSAERITFIDSVRSLAILCVIMCHVVELVYLLFEYRLPPIGMVYKLLIFSAFTLGRLGVPFFLLITGYLLLSRSYMPKDILCFWKSKWLRLFLTTDLWIILFYVLPCITNKGNFHFFILMKQMLFLEPCSYSHMWYMPMVLGLYLFLPFVALVLQKIPAKTLFFPGIMAFIWLFILPVANVLLTATEHSTVNSSLFRGRHLWLLPDSWLSGSSRRFSEYSWFVTFPDGNSFLHRYRFITSVFLSRPSTLQCLV